MKKFYKSLLVLLVIVFVTGTYGNQKEKSPLAVVTKVVNLVDKKQPESDWMKALKGDALFRGEHLRTGMKSVAIIKFTDRSMMRILENSELIMIGEKQKKDIKNKFDILRGAVGFEVSKRQNEGYTFTSPTSVASIRGTKGAFFVLINEDILILSSGSVSLKNKKSDQEVTVNVGEIGFSRVDGTIDVRTATSDELKSLDNTLKLGDTQKQNELKFEFRDSEGNKRELKIQYKE